MRNLCERAIINHRPRGKLLEHLSLGCTDLACWFVSETHFAGKLRKPLTHISFKKNPQIWNKSSEILHAPSRQEQKWDTRDEGFWLLQEPLHERVVVLERKRSSVWLAAIHFHQRWSCKGSSSALPSLLIVLASRRLPLKVIMQRLTKFWHSGYCSDLGVTLWNLVSERVAMLD